MPSQIAAGVLFAIGLFAGMLILLEVGRRVRRRRHALHGEAVGEGLGAVEAAMFGLMGLLVAFTFSGAVSRFDARRQLIVDEANAIGTAYVRLDLLKPEPRLALQQLLRDYVDARLAIYHAIPDSVGVHGALDRAAHLQEEIWRQAVPAVRDAPNPQLAGSLLPAINDMVDISTNRLAATQMHPPAIIFGLLALVALVCALLAGYAMAGSVSRSWIHIIGFAAVLSIAVYVIVDLEYPRLGLFKISEFDKMLIDVRASMR
jgi:hypothetical protein